MEIELVADGPALERVRGDWDTLAVTAGRPYCSPAWMLPWWRHAAPATAELRTLVARSGGEVVGIAPFFVDDWHGVARYRLLGSGTAPRCEPLARSGLTREVAAATARAVARVEPRPELVVLEGVAHDSPWPELLRNAWPAPTPRTTLHDTMSAPTLALAGRSYGGWLAEKSANFRQQTRRRRRRLEERGATFRLATAADVDRDLRDFAALHVGRWRRRGGSGVLDDRVEAMLLEVSRLLDPSRFRLWSLEVDGRTIASQLFLAAGGEVTYWLGGFDEAWAGYDPSIQTILAAIDHAFASGDDRLDLGPGAHPYKLRIADGEDLLRWVALVPRGPASGRAHALLALARVRRSLSERMPQRPKRLLKRVLRRAG